MRPRLRVSDSLSFIFESNFAPKARLPRFRMIDISTMVLNNPLIFLSKRNSIQYLKIQNIEKGNLGFMLLFVTSKKRILFICILHLLLWKLRMEIFILSIDQVKNDCFQSDAVFDKIVLDSYDWQFFKRHFQVTECSMFFGFTMMTLRKNRSRKRFDAILSLRSFCRQRWIVIDCRMDLKMMFRFF